MNGRQAAKAAAGRIEELEQRVDELERANARYAHDVKDYNDAIQHMIAGGSPCPYCEEHLECQLEAKDGKGCAEWWLQYPTEEGVNNADNDDGSRA